MNFCWILSELYFLSYIFRGLSNFLEDEVLLTKYVARRLEARININLYTTARETIFKIFKRNVP